jgi:translation elongation factor P/translation initiation factor 5A
MFSKKYTVTLLNSKWEIVKSNVKLISIPKKDEYVFMDNKYYDVLNVIHTIEKEHKILIIVEETKLKLDVNLGVKNQQ